MILTGKEILKNRNAKMLKMPGEQIGKIAEASKDYFSTSLF
jgi:hypothetical protein